MQLGSRLPHILVPHHSACPVHLQSAAYLNRRDSRIDYSLLQQTGREFWTRGRGVYLQCCSYGNRPGWGVRVVYVAIVEIQRKIWLNALRPACCLKHLESAAYLERVDSLVGHHLLQQAGRRCVPLDGLQLQQPYTEPGCQGLPAPLPAFRHIHNALQDCPSFATSTSASRQH